MAEFSAAPLGALERIYRFVGGLRGLRHFNLETDIQPVHDVSRQAELGLAPPMGYFIAGTDNVFAIAGTENWSIDPWAVIEGLYPGRQEMICWLIGAWVTSSVAITSARISLAYTPYASSIPRRDRLIDYVTNNVGIWEQGVAPATLSNAVYGSLPLTASIPLVMPPLATLRVQGTTAGAATVRTEGLFWAGPLGTRPPGIA